MINPNPLGVLALTSALLTSVTCYEAEGADKWSVDVSLYGIAAGMSGDVTVKGVDADLDVGFSDVLENLEFGAMGSVRVGYDRWALRTDVIYMGLGASKGPVSGDVDQWMVEPTVGYRICKGFEVLAGGRYNNINTEIRGTGPLGAFRLSSGTQDWWDPIVGANVRLPFASNLSFNVHGDIGGFDVGSDLTWQAFPYLSWQFTRRASLQAGYRWLFNDYETGSGSNRFKYDILTQGPQFGVSMGF